MRVKETSFALPHLQRPLAYEATMRDIITPVSPPGYTRQM